MERIYINYCRAKEGSETRIVAEKLNEIVKWINEHDKLEKDEEDPDYHIRGRSTK